MNKPLRVLLVEDSDDDALLVLRQLRDGGFAPQFERVDNSKNLALALDHSSWDVIISDHAMPGFSSLEALKIIKSRQLDIPFILVSGAIGEELAVEVMRAGAGDYVMKSHLPRLVPSVERELRDVANRHARRKAEESMAYLASIVDSSENAIIGTTFEGRILSWNEGARHMYGYTAAEAVGQPIAMLCPSSRPEELPEIFSRIIGGQRSEHLETVRLRKDETTLDVCLTISPIKNARGEVVGISSHEADITARKLEESERLQLIADLTQALASIKTLGGLLPICASCKKIRDDHGYWQRVESYIAERTEAEFSHGICPDCMIRLYPQYPARRGS